MFARFETNRSMPRNIAVRRPRQAEYVYGRPNSKPKPQIPNTVIILTPRSYQKVVHLRRYLSTIALKWVSKIPLLASTNPGEKEKLFPSVASRMKSSRSARHWKLVLCRNLKCLGCWALGNIRSRFSKGGECFLKAWRASMC